MSDYWKIAEQFNCPVCVELPDTEIYLCVNGHDVCGRCLGNLSHCPHCRVSFNKGKIRSRRVEEYLQNVEVICPYEGCVEIMMGKDVKKHRNICKHNGKWVDLCKLLNYKHCGFSVNLNDIPAAVQHFVECHKAHVTETSLFQTTSNHYMDFKKSTGCTWTPRILKIQHESSHLHFLRMTDHDQDFLSVSMLYLGEWNVKDLDKVRAQFIIPSCSEKMRDLEWTCKPVGILELGGTGTASHLKVRIATSVLSEHYVDSDGRLNLSTKLTVAFDDLE